MTVLPTEDWPEWLTPEHTAIHTAIENEMKRALHHCYQSADSAGMDWTWEGWISVSAGNIISMLRRVGSPPPQVSEQVRLPMPDPNEWSAEDDPVEVSEGKLVKLSDVPMDGTWELLHAGCDDDQRWITFTPKHHLAVESAASGVLLVARPIDISARIVAG